MLGLRCCVGFSLAVASRGHSWLQCMGFSLQWPSLVMEHGHRLNSCGTGAKLLHGMWDLPRPWIKLGSLALADRSFTTEHQGGPPNCLNYFCFNMWVLNIWQDKSCFLSHIIFLFFLAILMHSLFQITIQVTTKKKKKKKTPLELWFEALSIMDLGEWIHKACLTIYPDPLKCSSVRI